MSSKQRIEYIDIAKGIAIICVVLGHLGIAQINQVVFTFHLPIFFIITGYFTHADTPIQKFIKKKFRTLIVPYMATCFVIVILSIVRNILLKILIGTPENTWKVALYWIYASFYGAGDSYTEPFPIKAIGAIWFLLATFWSSIFLKYILKLKKGTRIASVLLLFAVGSWSRTLFWFPFSIQAGCCAVLFMYLGYLLNESKDAFKLIPMETRVMLSLLAFGVWACFVRDFQSFWLVHCDVGRGAVDIVGSIAGCYLLLLLSWYIENKSPYLTKPLAYLGKYSIFVLCAHIIELNLVPWGYFTSFMLSYGIPQLACILATIVGKFLWIIPCTMLCAKWNITRKIWGFPPLKG